MGKANCEHIIGATQGGPTIPQVQHNIMCVQKVTPQNNGVSDQ